jgi:hypothetical protein
MVKNVYSNRISEYAHENGGRVLLLFLLFCLAIYEFLTAGLPALAAICILPFIIIFLYLTFNWRTSAFWTLIIVNYFVQMKGVFFLPIPISLPNEMLQILLLALAIIDPRKPSNFERTLNPMLLALIIWCTFCIIEVFNDTCGLGINVSAWYTGARLLAFQLVYIFLVFCIYIASPEILMRYLKLWAFLSLFSAIWTWKQQYIGLTSAENAFLYGPGQSTHIIQGGTLIRYFSTFSDAANYGCNAAAAGVAFIIFGITAKIKSHKYLFLIIAFFVVLNMFASGTRTAMFCMFGAFAVYLILSKSMKIAIPAAFLGLLIYIFLAFTNIANGNQQVRRMRSAFSKNDASAKTRDINQETMKKYMRDAPWGIGIGMMSHNVPANNKYNRMANIPTDSEYVFIWLRTGKVGITVFLITTFMMFIGACNIVMFKLKSQSLIGIGGGLCCGFVALQLGGYANQVLMQFPNCLTFYGGLSIVYILPYLEPDWIEYEKKQLAKQEKNKQLRLEKKLAKRV